MIALGYSKTMEAAEWVADELIATTAGIVGVVAVLGLAASLAAPRWRGFTLGVRNDP